MAAELKTLWRLTKSSFSVLAEIIDEGEKPATALELNTLRAHIDQLAINAGSRSLIVPSNGTAAGKEHNDAIQESSKFHYWSESSADPSLAIKTTSKPNTPAPINTVSPQHNQTDENRRKYKREREHEQEQEQEEGKELEPERGRRRASSSSSGLKEDYIVTRRQKSSRQGGADNNYLAGLTAPLPTASPESIRASALEAYRTLTFPSPPPATTTTTTTTTITPIMARRSKDSSTSTSTSTPPLSAAEGHSSTQQQSAEHTAEPVKQASAQEQGEGQRTNHTQHTQHIQHAKRAKHGEHREHSDGRGRAYTDTDRIFLRAGADAVRIGQCTKAVAARRIAAKLGRTEGAVQMQLHFLLRAWCDKQGREEGGGGESARRGSGANNSGAAVDGSDASASIAGAAALAHDEERSDGKDGTEAAPSDVVTEDWRGETEAEEEAEEDL